MKRITWASLLTLLAGLACTLSLSHGVDPFYTSTGEWDSTRFPLIKPYEAGALRGTDDWSITIPDEPTGTLLGYLSVEHVQKIAVEDGVILVYTPYEPRSSSNLRGLIIHWFVFVPSRHIQTGFKDEGEFLGYVGKVGVSSIHWETPEAVNERFVATGCLDWIPECQ